MSYTNYPAQFDGLDLTSIDGLSVLATNPYAPPKRKLNNYNIAQTNRSKTPSGYYTDRALIVRVGISRTSRDLVETSVDSLMAILQGLEKELIIRVAGGLRKYVCTLEDVVLRVGGGAYWESDLVFFCGDRLGSDVADTLLAQVSNFTSGYKSTQIDIGGSAAEQLPVITITLNSVTGSDSSSTVQVSNGATGQQITITGERSAGDVIVINSALGEVTANGSDVAYSGAFPKFGRGVGYIQYADSFTGRNWSMTANHKRRWIN